MRPLPLAAVALLALAACSSGSGSARSVPTDVVSLTATPLLSQGGQDTTASRLLPFLPTDADVKDLGLTGTLTATPDSPTLGNVDNVFSPSTAVLPAELHKKARFAVYLNQPGQPSFSSTVVEMDAAASATEAVAELTSAYAEGVDNSGPYDDGTVVGTFSVTVTQDTPDDPGLPARDNLVTAYTYSYPTAEGQTTTHITEFLQASGSYLSLLLYFTAEPTTADQAAQARKLAVLQGTKLLARASASAKG